MTLEQLNIALHKLAVQPNREHVLEFSFALMEWMGIEPNAGKTPQLIAPKTQKLKEYLAPAPQTVQPQLYRISADNQTIRVRFSVLKKWKKEYITQLVDNDPGAESFQNTPDALKQITKAPYFIHFVTTTDYDRLVLIFNQGEQKKVVTLKNRLSNTQYLKVIQKWQSLAIKPKPEIANLFWKSLDLNEVNKDFYIKIKERFDGLLRIMVEKKPNIAEKDLKMFAIRLIGRYVFCWFLKEKEIIHSDLISSYALGKYEERYNTILKPLFFETLNTFPYPERKYSKGLPEELHKYLIEIPYLNGGLFEPSVEDDLIQEISIDDWLLSFVKLLEQYSFTIDESSPNYEQVAIDPEMLGKILENLLASLNPETEKLANERNALGAFYTPRSIVDYMVTESLKVYFESQLSDEEKKEQTPDNFITTANAKPSLFSHLEPKQMAFDVNKLQQPSVVHEKLRTRIDKLFDYSIDQNPFTTSETRKLKQALNEVRIIDPACGSGAFPMGVLHKLVMLNEKLGTDKSPYDLRRTILSQNIFGVDILPMAVEISRLRAWLALVLVSDYKRTDKKHNFNIKALPNLDFKFVCANTLIDSGYDDFIHLVNKTNTATLIRLLAEVEKLENIKEEYFNSNSSDHQKQNLITKFHNTKNYIKTEFALLKKRYNLDEFLNKIDDWNPFNDNVASTFFSPAWMFSISNGFDIVIGNPPYVGQKGHKEKFQIIKHSLLGAKYHQRRMDMFYFFMHWGLLNLKNNGVLCFITTNYFLTATYSDKLRKHFYEDSTILSLLNFNELKIFESATGQHNLISVFQKGRNNSVIANTAITKNVGLANNTILRSIFEKTDSETAYYKQTQSSLFEEGTLYIRIEPNQSSSNTSSVNIHSILHKIKTGNKTLKEYCCIEQGIVSGADKVSDSIINRYPKLNLTKGDGIFILTKKEVDDLNLNNEEQDVIKPIYKNSDLKKWHFKPQKQLFLVYLKDEGKPIELSKKLERHFEKFKDVLVDKKENCFKNPWLKKIVQPWLQRGNYFVLFYPRNKDSFEKMKIVNSRRANSNIFAYEDKCYYEQSDIVFTTLKPIYENKLSLLFILGILNSKLIYHWFYHKGKRKGEALELFQKPISEVPIKYVPEDLQNPIVELVHKIILSKKQNVKADVSNEEKQLDILVYHLYNLTYDDAKIIDPALSEEEFNKYKIEDK
jgi:adenine-specific DNA-methyltransferase